jgi:adenylyltransferase/sulfurtransferase
MDITASELSQRMAAGESLNLLDVRGQLEYSTYNIGGLHLSLPKFPGAIDDIEWDKDDEIIVMCARGLRSHSAELILIHSGFTNVRNLKGGLIELQKLNKDQ